MSAVGPIRYQGGPATSEAWSPGTGAKGLVITRTGLTGDGTPMSGVEMVPTTEHLIDAFDLRTNMGSPDACALQSAESMNGTGHDTARSLKPAHAALRETSGQALVHGSVGGGCKTVRLCPP